MNVAIVKYTGGNTQSVVFALERLGVQPIVTDAADQLTSADKVIFPGVGEAGTAMAYLQERKLDQLLMGLRQPVLGICLGMQLMCRHTEEGNTNCLGIFDVPVVRFKNGKVPHMGWNTVQGDAEVLMKGMDSDSFFYFVHSYFAPVCPFTSGATQYTEQFSSVLQKDNFYGVQFHPEKSAAAGSRLLQNFLEL